MKILVTNNQFKRVILVEQQKKQGNKKDFSNKSNIATQKLWDHIRKWETFVPFTYDDAYFPPNPYTGDSKDTVGVLTIGYGHTGEDVTVGDEISEKEATSLLIIDVNDAADCIRRWVLRQKKKKNKYYLITQGMYEAMTDLAYNLGCSRFINSSIIVNIENGNYKKAAEKIRKLGGDTRRREETAKIFCSNQIC